MTANNHTILMVLESLFPKPGGGGGAEGQLRTIGRCLAAQGVTVRIVVPKVASGRQQTHEVVDGLEVTRIAYPKIRLFGTVVLLLRLALLLVARRREYRVIHAHIGHNMAAVCCLMGRMLRKPTVVKFTGMHEMRDGVLSPSPGLAGRLRKRGMQLATYYQAISGEIARRLKETGYDPARIRRIPNGVDTDRFAPRPGDPALRRQLCGRSGTVLGVYTGRLIAEKGVASLLRAWGRVAAGYPHARLVLVGDGPLRNDLAALARDLEVARQVTFAGNSDHVEQYLAVADFGILPSEHEGLSNTLLEYMACGLPVLGSRISGTEDFVRPGRNGWLYAAGSDDELAARLREAMDCPLETRRRMGQQGREDIMGQAATQAVTMQLLRLYGLNGGEVHATMGGTGSCAAS